jgi:predicted transcriptional regulator
MGGLEHPSSPGRDTPRVGEIMRTEVVTVAPEDTVFRAAEQMTEQNSSCVIVLYRSRVVGILTAKDLLNTVAARGTGLHRLGVSEQMSSPVDTVSANRSVLEAGRIMELRRIRRLPVVEDGRLVGLVTRTDMTRALLALHPPGGLPDTLTKHVAMAGIDITVLDAARLLSGSVISCLIVTRQEAIAGILTEKDLLRRIVSLPKDPTCTRVTDVGSLPVMPVPSRRSLLDAVEKIKTLHLHRLDWGAL